MDRDTAVSAFNLARELYHKLRGLPETEAEAAAVWAIHARLDAALHGAPAPLPELPKGATGSIDSVAIPRPRSRKKADAE